MHKRFTNLVTEIIVYTQSNSEFSEATKTL